MCSRTRKNAVPSKYYIPFPIWFRCFIVTTPTYILTYTSRYYTNDFVAIRQALMQCQICKYFWLHNEAGVYTYVRNSVDIFLDCMLRNSLHSAITLDRNPSHICALVLYSLTVKTFYRKVSWKYQHHKIIYYNLMSSIAADRPFKFQSDLKTLCINRAASRFHAIMWLDANRPIVE